MLVKIAAAALTTLCLAAPAIAKDTPMSFFITSVGLGDGANLGGLEGADAHCQTLAEAAGSEGQTWAAYLSTQIPNGRGVSARDRIGSGPWHNAKGDLIAANVDQLHILPNLYTSTGLNEKGEPINHRGGGLPVEHDILTGSQVDGTAFPPRVTDDMTCSNWTSNDVGSAMVGHHDRNGGGSISWNASHPSRGCSADNLKSTGGNGYFYCFAVE
jgi:hypothetical protein